MSFFVRFEISELYVKLLPLNAIYSHHKYGKYGTNSNVSILKTKNFLAKFYFIFRIHMKYRTFLKKTLEPYSLSIFKIVNFEKDGYLNAYEVFFFRTYFGSQCVHVSQTMHKYVKSNFYSRFSSA